MNQYILLTEVLKIPDPHTIITLFSQILVHFWRAEEMKYVCPQHVSQVRLQVDHLLYQKKRYHLYEIHSHDFIGLWDETPYHIEFRYESTTWNHDDYRHCFQLFLISFLEQIQHYRKYYPELDRFYNVLVSFPILDWKCNVCRCYKEWSQNMIETFLTKEIVLDQPFLLFLLTHKNQKIGEDVSENLPITPLKRVLEDRLFHFIKEFQKIATQTTTDHHLILDPLLSILEKYTSTHTTDQIEEFENVCAKDMKTHLYQHFKFLQTKDIRVSQFPRQLMMIRDLFAIMVTSWATSDSSSSSPGILFLLFHVLLEDRVLKQQFTEMPFIVFHRLDNVVPMIRHMTPTELTSLRDHHPLLRQTIFCP